MRRLPHAPVPGLQRQQEVRQQEHLHGDLRGPEVQSVRRLGTGQVRPVLSDMKATIDLPKKKKEKNPY